MKKALICIFAAGLLLASGCGQTSGTDTVGRNISPPQRSSKPTAAIYSDTLTMRAARTVRALTDSSRSELWAALPW